MPSLIKPSVGAVAHAPRHKQLVSMSTSDSSAYHQGYLGKIMRPVTLLTANHVSSDVTLLTVVTFGFQ